jgi:hypothetical protein
MGKEALELHIYGLEKDGGAPPDRSNAIPELDRGDLVVPVSIYPDLVNAELDNR